jgi:hypothetical protein
MEENRTQWFLDRIGKRVFRDDVTCECGICKGVTSHGLIIDNEMHADYLCMVEATPSMEVKYFDTMDEVLEFKLKAS